MINNFEPKSILFNNSDEMKSILIVSLFFLSVMCYSQDLMVVDFISSECDNSVDILRIKDRVVSQYFVGDTLVVEIGITATCCVDFIPSASMNKNVINLIFRETGNPCYCNCCYQFTYYISGVKKTDYMFELNGAPIEISDEKYHTYPISFKIENGDTINYKDKYGLRQGKWVYQHDDKSYRIERYVDGRIFYEEGLSYNDNSEIGLLMVSKRESEVDVQFYDNWKIKRIEIRNLNYKSTQLFYEDGTMKEIEVNGSKDFNMWRFYYPNGQLRKERFFNRSDQLWAMYYYDTGEIMAKYWVLKESEFSSPTYKWQCYNKSGDEIERKILIDSGLLEK